MKRCFNYVCTRSVERKAKPRCKDLHLRGKIEAAYYILHVTIAVAIAVAITFVNWVDVVISYISGQRRRELVIVTFIYYIASLKALP